MDERRREAFATLGENGDGSGSLRHESRELQRIRAALIHGDGIKSIPPAAPLIEGVLDLDSLAAIYGPSGAFKTVVVASWVLSVATGSWWFGHEVAQGPVLSVIAEGASGIGQRVEAWEQRERVYTAGDVHWLPLVPNLLQRESREALVAIATELQPVLVTIDTLARTIPGGNENSHETMSAVIDAGDRIRQATGGACVLYVHHTGLDKTRARGHTSLLGALDTEIACERSDQALTLRATKQRNHADGGVIANLVRDRDCGQHRPRTTRLRPLPAPKSCPEATTPCSSRCERSPCPRALRPTNGRRRRSPPASPSARSSGRAHDSSSATS